MQSRKFQFDSALTPQGWQRDVTVTVDGSGMITQLGGAEGGESISGIAVPAMPNVHSHAHQRFMLGPAGDVVFEFLPLADEGARPYFYELH